MRYLHLKFCTPIGTLIIRRWNFFLNFVEFLWLHVIVTFVFK